jgi:ABC-type multidrug transport system ATPase subunit
VTDTARVGDLAIETRALTKRFGQQTAVDAIDLAVPTGSVFGFLGPNGSGKTTSIRVMLGLAAATSGQVSVLGEAMPGRLGRVLPQVGALVEGPAFYPFLSGAANLRRLDTADRAAPSRSRRTRVDRALERVGLSNAAGKKVSAYSLGMKQRLGIANALLMPRRLLVLDEPTNGLDPQGTREVRALVRSLSDEGTTVFVSSHLLAEVEHMCTHAAIMSAGRLVAQGTLDELRAGESRVRVRTPDATSAVRVLAAAGLEAAAEPAPGPDDLGGGPGDGWVSAPLDSPAGERGGRPLPEELVAALVAGGVRVRGFEVQDTSLEDRFVALTGEGFDVVR